MKGVRILNEISPVSTGIWVVIGIFFLISIGFFLWSFANFDLERKDVMMGVLVGSLIPIIASILLFFTKYTSPMKYEAIIDDNVKISEFEEKYKIIKKRGDIYVIEENEDGN